MHINPDTVLHQCRQLIEVTIHRMRTTAIHEQDDRIRPLERILTRRPSILVDDDLNIGRTLL